MSVFYSQFRSEWFIKTNSCEFRSTVIDETNATGKAGKTGNCYDVTGILHNHVGQETLGGLKKNRFIPVSSFDFLFEQ